MCDYFWLVDFSLSLVLPSILFDSFAFSSLQRLLPEEQNVLLLWKRMLKAMVIYRTEAPAAAAAHAAVVRLSVCVYFSSTYFLLCQNYGRRERQNNVHEQKEEEEEEEVYYIRYESDERWPISKDGCLFLCVYVCCSSSSSPSSDSFSKPLQIRSSVQLSAPIMSWNAAAAAVTAVLTLAAAAVAVVVDDDVVTMFCFHPKGA